MTEADHFGLWACQLQLIQANRIAYAMHDGFCEGIERGDLHAVRWMAGGRLAMWREAENYEEGGRG